MGDRGAWGPGAPPGGWGGPPRSQVQQVKFVLNLKGVFFTGPPQKLLSARPIGNSDT